VCVLGVCVRVCVLGVLGVGWLGVRVCVCVGEWVRVFGC